MKKAYLDLSTAHLSRDTQNLLDERIGHDEFFHLCGWPPLSMARYTYGYFITVPDPLDEQVIEQMKDMPQDLRCCLLHAASEQCELIRFDADGYVDGDLPYYKEI